MVGTLKVSGYHSVGYRNKTCKMSEKRLYFLTNPFRFSFGPSDHTSLGSIFTTRDILNATPEVTRELVDQVISRMIRNGELQRISRGLFSRSETHMQLGPLPPSTNEIAIAIERSLGVPITPAGATALNALHLSTQVPVKPEFFTAGPSRTIYVRNLPIRLRHASIRRFRVQHAMVRLIIEALRTLGQDHITKESICKIRSTISESDRVALSNHIGDAPVWMQPYLRRIAAA